MLSNFWDGPVPQGSMPYSLPGVLHDLLFARCSAPHSAGDRCLMKSRNSDICCGQTNASGAGSGVNPSKIVVRVDLVIALCAGACGNCKCRVWRRQRAARVQGPVHLGNAARAARGPAGGMLQGRRLCAQHVGRRRCVCLRWTRSKPAVHSQITRQSSTPVGVRNRCVWLIELLTPCQGSAAASAAASKAPTGSRAANRTVRCGD